MSQYNPMTQRIIYDSKLYVLMVSPEYPPMAGGVGRYTANLSWALSKMDSQYEAYKLNVDQFKQKLVWGQDSRDA